MKKILSILFSIFLTSNSFAQVIYPSQNGLQHTRGIIASLRSANFNVTTDQSITIRGPAVYRIVGIEVTNCTVSMTTAQGGFYSAISKGGTVIVAATQAYTSLTTQSFILDLTMANSTTRWASQSVIYFSLTTAQGATATCDIYVIGDDLT